MRNTRYTSKCAFSKTQAKKLMPGHKTTIPIQMETNC